MVKNWTLFVKKLGQQLTKNWPEIWQTFSWPAELEARLRVNSSPTFILSTVEQYISQDPKIHRNNTIHGKQKCTKSA